MKSIRSEVAKFHAKGRRAAETFRQSSSDLIDVLQWMDRNRGYLEFELTSVYLYATEKLKLSEDVACNLIAIARKSYEVPALKESVRAGEMSVSNARKIVSVITEENQAKWIKLASESTTRVVQKEIARENPKAAVIESVKYVTASRLELKLGISEELDSKLARARDVLAQKRQCAVTLEDVIDSMADCFLRHHDPVEKANRSLARADKRTDIRAGIQANHGPANAAEDLSVTKRIPESDPVTQDLPAKCPTTIATSCESTVATACASEMPLTQDRIATPGQEAARSCSIHSHQLSPSRRPLRSQLQASIRHQVNARDKGQCTERDAQTGKRCSNSRWTDVHHIRPLAHGGSDDLCNLTTLCSVHHRMKHR